MNDILKVIISFAISICIVALIWYFVIGEQSFEERHIESIVKKRIIVEEGYRLDSIDAIEYSANWWYISIYLFNLSTGRTSWNLLRYYDIENRFEYENLNNIELR